MGYFPENTPSDFDENHHELVGKVIDVETKIDKLAAVVYDLQDDIRILVQRQMQIQEKLEKGIEDLLFYAINKG